MIARWRALPEAAQDALLGVLFGAAWFGFSTFAEAQGWNPRHEAAYDLAGFASAVAVGIRRVVPWPALVTLAFAYAVAYDVPLQSEFHLLPLLILAYAAARQAPVPAAAVALSCLTSGLLLSSGALLVRRLPGAPVFRNWSEIVFGEFAIGVMVLLGVVTAAQRRTATMLAARNAELERLRQVEAGQAVAEERNRIARELHDDVAHHLTALIVRAQAAERVAGSQPEVAVESVGWMAETARLALNSVRQTVSVLRTDGDGPATLAPGPSLADLPPLVARFRDAGIEVDLTVPPALPALEPQVHHALVRIVQESLTNVLRHSGAGHVDVRLEEADQGLVLTVADDGVGPDPAAPPGSGHGLPGMRERAASCGGRLSVERGPRGGWLVQAWVPCAVPAVGP